ncbi:3-phytase B precursor [Dendryphion nanum]|uniref:3-phytase B n=1 Tax=Dendryphion nanum TaxID=256645 RepID=A0A9P9ICW6_9PLEO|nr:3-phytase B precursor [Dendryphion nanum]
MPISTNRAVSILASIFVTLFALQYQYFSSKTCPVPASTPEPPQHPPSSESHDSTCSNKPHHASWGSWIHPQRLLNLKGAGKESASAVTKDWNILYHLGGNGPWIEKIDDVLEGGIGVPEGCIVEQVHMMSRHAERYPTLKAGTRMRKLFNRMKNSNVTFKGDLSFTNDWELFWSDDTHLAQLTSTGPFSGTLSSFTTGTRLRTRYSHLLPTPSSPPVTLWASDSDRVIDTARYFAAGLFGLDYSTKNTAQLQVIPETSDLGADSLTPGDTCPRYVEDEEEGWAKGWKTMHAYRATYLHVPRARLLAQNPGVEFSDDELYAMQEMCGFETTVRGSSQWCDVFTREEWEHFEYARDLHHYYRAGPGTKYGAGLGFLWLNATVGIMNQGPEAGKLFFSFVHDDDMAPLLAAVDFIDDIHPLPTTHIPRERLWRKSQISPMGGRIIFEVMACKWETQSHMPLSKFVRININDGIHTIPGCDKGPGGSCRLSAFTARTRRKGIEVGGFREMCGLGEGAAERITFLHQ